MALTRHAHCEPPEHHQQEDWHTGGGRYRGSADPDSMYSADENPQRHDEIEDTQQRYRLDVSAPDGNEWKQEADRRANDDKAGPEDRSAPYTLHVVDAAPTPHPRGGDEQRGEHRAPDEDGFSPDRYVPVPQEDPESHDPDGGQQRTIAAHGVRATVSGSASFICGSGRGIVPRYYSA